ncbi:hypothetical protein ET445_16720 [Agromyces protaetiae]|uniref:D-serine dehydratase-like domain-containing protein n=1 Tax=Agromyces protaetiae TaxID=2509455 RepID=A0A4P6FHX5_9MICO|nr:alanine racemase [Agromyces protaetiae]QAY74733.1 hypothetical protein ET445_16720 [Agromyces protaetiae]
MPRATAARLDTAALAALGDLELSLADQGVPARAAGLTVREFLATSPTLDEFWTPLTVLDGSALARNADAIQAWATAHGLELMPHGKTTMAPELWEFQLARGATGLTLATPGQVRIARGFGASSIQLANALVAPHALAWLAGELADEGFSFWCWADSIETVEAMERGLETSGAVLPRPIDVLVELGAPGGRTGARSDDAALDVARRIHASPVLRLGGVAGYEGSLGHDRSPGALAAVRDYLDRMVALFERIRAGHDGELMLTAGGSAYLDVVAEAFAPAIEAAAGRTADDSSRFVLRSGASLVHDDGFYRGISPLGGELVAAMRGYARVVSHPEPGLALLDGGKRDFPYDEGLPVPLHTTEQARLTSAPGTPLTEASVTALNDQHAFVRVRESAPSGAALALEIGDVVALGLSHPCTAFDKRRLLPVIAGDGDDTVVGLVRTFF